ncbi:hypothetical protein GDO81_002864 [Engystomops pustulosus]|uniref:UDP-glucuronosyltransferase n=1 Tax=Engystomops pustulosus TaxID=76066 RepID=A0AAV7DNE5_ENGPU|nr:hypothetical protein GDO81_002864 [Engystomops pustulosus]
MAGGRAPRVLVLLCILHLHCLQGFKILTVCLAGGSHYLLMDDVSRIFVENGHDVRMFQQIGKGSIPGYKLTSTPYPVTTYTLDEKLLKEYDDMFEQSQKEFFMGNAAISSYFTLMDLLAEQCQATMNQTEIFDFLKKEKFDIVILEAFNPCTFFVAEKLGVPYIALFSGSFFNFMSVGLPSPPSYVPMFPTGHTDRMNFLERVKNTFMYLGSYVMDKIIESIFSRVSEAHFPADSKTSLGELYQKAELWLYNVDFSIEFARPLLPHVQCIGGLRAKPAKPVSKDLEDFIAESGDSGFILVALGSMISSIPITDVLREMNSAFASVPQKVIWRYKASQWPEDLKLASNVKLMDWVNQNDLLGHPKMRLMVSHGGLNGLMEAIYHGVPVLGIPLFGDHSDNLARIKARFMGDYIPPYEIKSDNFGGAIRRITQNKR